jgi:hypothetical protein
LAYQRQAAELFSKLKEGRGLDATTAIDHY